MLRAEGRKAMINMDYLKGRLAQAKAADSDVVRIGIEEFEELIEEDQ